MGYIGLEYRVLGEARGRVFWPGEQCERLGQSLDDWTRVGTSAREGYKSDLVSPSRCHTKSHRRLVFADHFHFTTDSTCKMTAEALPHRSRLGEVEVIPGTIHLVDSAGDLETKRGTGTEHDIVLVPAPSAHPDDPLNWRPRRKYISAFCMALYVTALLSWHCQC